MDNHGEIIRFVIYTLTFHSAKKKKKSIAPITFKTKFLQAHIYSYTNVAQSFGVTGFKLATIFPYKKRKILPEVNSNYNLIVIQSLSPV